MATTLMACIASAGVAYIGAQSKISPFVVAIDKMGSPIAIGKPVATSLSAINQRIVIAQVANWIWNARSILPDPDAQKMLIDKVYAMSSADTGKYLNSYYTNHTPYLSDGTVVRTTINSVLPVGGSTYELSWTESRSQPGFTAKTTKWKATVTVGQNPKIAEKPAVALNNPLGLFIKTLSWGPVVG